MNYNDVLNYYLNSPKFLPAPSNPQLIKLLAYLGNPQDNLKYIHIAGTNGKGSVCLMLSECFFVAGYKTGLFTSPYIEVFNERIQINGKNISDCDLIYITEIIKNATDTLNLELTAFAKITAAAFLYFSMQKCDIVILETGLGGRLDSTNVIVPEISVITKIGLDHTEYLGDTISQIATEKAGIIKQNIPVVTTINQPLEAMQIIKDTAKKNNSALILADSNSDYKLGLLGDFQKENSAIAVSVLKYMKIDEKSIKQGLMQSHWPARFEFLKDNLLIDGAHNPNGIEVLLQSLAKLNRPVHFVIAMMKDKNYRDSAKMIADFGGKVTVTQIDTIRCLKATELASSFKNAIIDLNPLSAVKNALLNAENDELVCVIGSLYLAGEIRKNFKP